MCRFAILCLGLGTLGQVLPEGCLVGTPQDAAPPPMRGVIMTEATAPASAAVGETVALSATATADVDGGGIAYHWAQTAGPGVAILDADQATARFVAPSLPVDQTLRFLVTTLNERGDVGRAAVAVLVQADPNYGTSDGSDGSGGSRPVARAGADRTVPGGRTATLDGSASRGTGLTYSWRQVSGPTVTLKDPDKARATFTMPAFFPGVTIKLEFELEVRDLRGRRATDRVVLTVGDPGDDPKPRVKLETSKGNIVIELDRTKAPVTVRNFLQYVDDAFYDGLLFHRVIPDFVIQGGGYKPGLIEKTTRDPIANEASNGLKNLRGAIAMARTRNPDSATSQFYINLVDNSSLDYSPNNPGYAVFGTVIEGMDVVDAIAAVRTESRQGFENVPVEDVLIIRAVRVAGAGGGGGDDNSIDDPTP